MRLRRFGDGSLLRTMPLPGYGVRCALTPDGEHAIASCADSTMTVWRTSDGRLLRTFRLPDTKHCYAIRVTADGKHIVAGTFRGASGARVHVWRFSDGELLATGHHEDGVRGVALHPDGRHVASASMDGTIKIWRLSGNDRGGTDLQPVQALHGDDSAFSAVTFTPDGSWIVAGDMDGEITIWGVP